MNRTKKKQATNSVKPVAKQNNRKAEPLEIESFLNLTARLIARAHLRQAHSTPDVGEDVKETKADLQRQTKAEKHQQRKP